MNILAEIVENKKKEIKILKRIRPLSKLKEKYRLKNINRSGREIYASLKGKNNIIAEIKFDSPSRRIVCKNEKNKNNHDKNNHDKNNHDKNNKRNIKHITEAYDRYASAISIVTDRKFFGGNIDFIKEARKYTQLPILRKDFIIDKYQVYESRYYGADAILLIAALLSAKQIDSMINTAKKLNMECIIEVRTRKEISKVLKTKARIIGINNRNLETLEVDLNTTKRLKKFIPKDKIIVSESGINSKKEIISLGTNAVLVGTSLMISPDITKKMQSLHRIKVKICGITNKADALIAIDEGADILGFNFYRGSPRYISPKKAESIIHTLPNTVQTAGVFVNSSLGYIKDVKRLTNIDIIQLHEDKNKKFCTQLDGNIIKAFRVKNNQFKNYMKFKVYARLFDSYSKHEFGGTGKTFNKNLLKNIDGKIFVAGGLNERNIKDVFSVIRPYCLDICSGVEKKKDKNKRKRNKKNTNKKETNKKGIKDRKKIRKFIEKVREYEKKH